MARNIQPPNACRCAFCCVDLALQPWRIPSPVRCRPTLRFLSMHPHANQLGRESYDRVVLLCGPRRSVVYGNRLHHANQLVGRIVGDFPPSPLPPTSCLPSRPASLKWGGSDNGHFPQFATWRVAQLVSMPVLFRIVPSLLLPLLDYQLLHRRLQFGRHIWLPVGRPHRHSRSAPSIRAHIFPTARIAEPDTGRLLIALGGCH